MDDISPEEAARYVPAPRSRGAATVRARAAEDAWVDLAPRSSLSSGRGMNLSASDASETQQEAYERATTGDDAASELDRDAQAAALRRELEDRDLTILELRAAHASEVAALRSRLEEQTSLVDAKKREIDGIRAAARDDVNRSMSSALVSEDLLARLHEENDQLRLRLRVAEDNYQELAHATKHGKAAATISALQTELMTTRTELAAVRGELSTRVRELAARDTEMESIRSHVGTQQTQVRALHQQLSGFIRKEAADTARAIAAEQERDTIRAELEKRLEQLGKVVKALSKAKDREVAVSATLEAQTVTVGTLQNQLAALSHEHQRMSEERNLLREQHAEFLQRFEAMQARIDELEAQQAASEKLMTAASSSADHISTLSTALQSARAEIETLSTALSNARADARRETLQLQRIADDRQATVHALQADLAAATSALASLSSGRGAAQSASEAARDAFTEAEKHDSAAARSVARRRGQPMGVTGGKPIRIASILSSVAQGGRESDASPNGAIDGDAVTLRLQLDGLSRRLLAEQQRVKTLQQEQDELLLTNERLRHALQGGGQKTSDAVAPVDTHSPAPACIMGLWQELVASDDALRHAHELHRGIARFMRAVRAVMDGSVADVLEDDTFAPAAPPSLDSATRFSRCWSALTSARVALHLSLDVHREWVDVSQLDEAATKLIADVAALHTAVQDHSLTSMGSGCPTQ